MNVDEDEATVDSHGLHSCSICLYNAQCKCDLTMHMFWHRNPLNPNTFKCPFCEYKSNEPGNNFQQHLLSHKTSCSKLKCCICDYLSKSAQELDSHMFLHKDTFDVNFFKCSLCQYKTKTLANLTSHMLVHETMLKCCVCDKEYLSKNELAKHFIKHKDPNDLHWYKCDFCDHRSKHVSSLRLHCITHKDFIEGLKCCICNHRCEKEGNLEEHMSLHKDPENVEGFNCFLCDHKTRQVEDLKIHLSTHNRRTGDRKTYCNCPSTYESRKENASHHKIYYCDQCDYTAKFKSVFKNHQSRHQLSKCDICDLQMNEFDRKRHNNIFHSKNPNDSMKTFKCCICNCKSESKGDLAKHFLTHYTKNICVVCKNKTRTKDQLSWISHMLLHSIGDEVKKHRCDLCTFRTADFSKLKRHKETHKDRSERNLCKCTVCGAEYTTKASLKSHMEVHEDGLEMPMHYCDQCDYKTQFKSTMKRHKLRHEIKKCYLCDLEMTEYDLKNHNELFHSDNANDSNNTFKCCLCEFKCQTKSDLAKHLLSHKNPNNICDICGCKSSKEASWISHMFIHSNDDIIKSYNCDVCSYCTTNINNLQRHKETHKERSERNLFRCKFCDARYTKKKSLVAHMEVHNNQGDTSEVVLYQCKQCDYKTKSKSSRHRHKLKHQLVKCDTCEMELNEFDRKRHDDIFHCESENDSMKSLKCCMCNCKCETKGDLATHLLSHYSMNTCSICKYKTKDELSWISHMLVHSNEDEAKKYECDLCTFRTVDFASLKRHKEVHKDRSDRILFKCTHCGAEYTTKASLKSHLEVHEDSSETHRCDQCDYKTNLKSRMKRHILRHQVKKCQFCNLSMSECDLRKHDEIFHSESADDLNNIFRCCICDCKFETKSDLANHLLTHKKPNNVCDICKCKSNTEVSWIWHTLIHSNVNLRKSYTCDYCSYSTTNSRNLRRHKDTHKERSERDLFKCIHCDAQYTAKRTLESHMELHTRQADPSEAIFYNCEQCDYKTKFRSVFEKHKSKHQLLKCDVCDLEMNKFNRKRHDEIFHSESDNDSMKALKCCMCNCECTTKGDLAKHLLSHYSTNICSVCKYKAKDELSWISHMLLHSKREESKKYQCDVCSFCTANFTRLKCHKEIHKNRSERKLFKCTQCGGEYTTKASLKSHMEVHKDDLETHHCDQCDYKTKLRSSMRQHKARHLVRKCNFCNLNMNEYDLRRHNEIFHSDSLNDSNNPFKCCICEFKSETKSDFAKHLLNHKNRNNICDICGCKFGKEVSWISHMFIHSNVNIPESYNCEECAYSTTNVNNLQRHKKTHKECSEQSLFKCVHCDVKYKKKISLKLHMEVHNDHTDHGDALGVVLYQCDRCDYRTKDRSCMRLHNLQHQSVKCGLCNSEIENQLEVKKHVENFHPGSLKMFGFCCVCDSSFETKVNLAKHFLLHKDETNFTLLKCDTCDYKTKCLNLLKLHKRCGNCQRGSGEIMNIALQNKDTSSLLIQSHGLEVGLQCHTSSEVETSKVMKCRSCNFKTKSRSYLTVHIRTKHPNKLKCCICDYKFITKLDLARHLLLHKDSKRFKCNSCNYKTHYLAHLKLHLQKHKPAGDKPFRCDVCQFEATNITRLKRHKEIHEDPSKRKYFGCLSCDSRYTTKAALKTHMLRHENPSGIKMYRCGNCDFKTMHRGSLNDHKLHVHADPAKWKGYKCEFCGLRMKRKDSLKMHVKKFHNGT